MAEGYSIRMIGDITYIKLTESIPLKQVKELVHVIIADYNYERRIWDMSEIEFDLTQEQVRDLAAHGIANYQGYNKLALVISGDLEFAEMRQFGSYRSNKTTDFGLFRTLDEALEWLNG